VKKLLLFLLLIPTIGCAQPFSYSNGERYYLVLENKKVVDYHDDEMILGPDGCFHHIPTQKRIVTIVEYTGEGDMKKRTPYPAQCDLEYSNQYWRKYDTKRTR
jgi:hypothetical protein